MISYQDDHSRFITGSTKIWSPTGENALKLLEKTVKRYGVPEQILTIRERSSNLPEGEHQSLTGAAASLGLSISPLVNADPPHRARSKRSTRRTR